MPTNLPAHRQDAYASAYALLRAAAASDPMAFGAAFERALDQLADAFPDDVPAAAETLMAYAAALGQAGPRCQGAP